MYIYDEEKYAKMTKKDIYKCRITGLLPQDEKSFSNREKFLCSISEKYFEIQDAKDKKNNEIIETLLLAFCADDADDEGCLLNSHGHEEVEEIFNSWGLKSGDNMYWHFHLDND